MCAPFRKTPCPQFRIIDPRTELIPFLCLFLPAHGIPEDTCHKCSCRQHARCHKARRLRYSGGGFPYPGVSHCRPSKTENSDRRMADQPESVHTADHIFHQPDLLAVQDQRDDITSAAPEQVIEHPVTSKTSPGRCKRRKGDLLDNALHASVSRQLQAGAFRQTVNTQQTQTKALRQTGNTQEKESPMQPEKEASVDLSINLAAGNSVPAYEQSMRF